MLRKYCGFQQRNLSSGLTLRLPLSNPGHLRTGSTGLSPRNTKHKLEIYNVTINKCNILSNVHVGPMRCFYVVGICSDLTNLTFVIFHSLTTALYLVLLFVAAA